MQKLDRNLLLSVKRAFVPMPGGQPPPDPMQGGMPMDPAMQGMQGGMPMDPAMAGGAAPMDPAMAGGAAPMDPAMAGAAGAAPMDPAMAGAAGAAPMDPAMAGAAPAPQEGQLIMSPTEFANIVSVICMAIQGRSSGATEGGEKPAGAGNTSTKSSGTSAKLDQILQLLGGAAGGAAVAPAPAAPAV